MEKVYNELTALINAFFTKYKDLDEKITAARPPGDAWGTKEIIGHLVDSACNNHQRFIRMQLKDKLIFPDYGADNQRWIQLAHYTEMSFTDLLLLWKQYNLLLAQIIRTVDPATMDHYWQIGEEKRTLAFLMKDYLSHLRNHLQQFEEAVLRVTNL